MTNDPSLMQIETRNSFLPNSPPAVPSRLSRAQYPSLLRMLMRIGPSFTKIGKAVLYPLEELDRSDRRNVVVCRPSRSLPLEKAAE
jgi:hypothetical protein